PSVDVRRLGRQKPPCRGGQCIDAISLSLVDQGCVGERPQLLPPEKALLAKAVADRSAPLKWKEANAAATVIKRPPILTFMKHNHATSNIYAPIREPNTSNAEIL
ncbi:hypothetical protein, partial [Methylobacterium oxalidis]